MCGSVNCSHGDPFAGLEDSDEDLFQATSRAIQQGQVKANTALAEAQLGVHTEPCKACRGSGRYYSYSGRLLGNGFKCKGKGTLTFKSSPAQREKNRDYAAKRKVVKAENNAETFATEFAAEQEWMVAAAARGFDFATSMLEAVRKYGHLTERQLVAVRSCVARDIERAERKAREAAEQAARLANAATVAGIQPIVDAFASAKGKGIKRPKVRLGDFVLSLAPDHGRNAGSIYVVRKDDDQYLGKIADARFFPVRDCNAEAEAQILAVCSNPAETAVAYGRRTGECCICGRELTNGESIDRGIGPICAERFGW